MATPCHTPMVVSQKIADGPNLDFLTVKNNVNGKFLESVAD
jgi:hypothetical protein